MVLLVPFSLVIASGLSWGMGFHPFWEASGFSSVSLDGGFGGFMSFRGLWASSSSSSSSSSSCVFLSSLLVFLYSFFFPFSLFLLISSGLS